MNLKQLIEYLEKKDRDIIVPVGFDKPRLCIGDYTCLAFEPAGDVTVGAMLQCARSSVGATYRNWLDDEYQMHGGTEVYLAMSGCVGEKIGGVLLDYMTGVYDDEEIKNLRSVINKSTYEIAGLIAERDHVRTDLAFADDTIHGLTVERDTIGADLVTADRIIHKLKAELCSVESDRDIMFQNYRNTIAKLQGDIIGLEVELSACKSDSEVLMKVVNVVRDWDDSTGRAFPTLYKIVDLLVDYTDISYVDGGDE